MVCFEVRVGGGVPAGFAPCQITDVRALSWQAKHLLLLDGQRAKITAEVRLDLVGSKIQNFMCCEQGDILAQPVSWSPIKRLRRPLPKAALLTSSCRLCPARANYSRMVLR